MIHTIGMTAPIHRTAFHHQDKTVEIAVKNFLNDDMSISCKKGCGACCVQLVPISDTEVREIEKLISHKPTEIKIPAKVEIAPTPKEEHQQIAMEIDKIKRAKDPEFKGAFHEKKQKPKAAPKKSSRQRKKRKRR